MHESSLAQQVLRAVLASAADAHASRVRVVRGWVAETEALSSESLALQFAAYARGTLADGARLDLRLIHVEARCRSCGQSYAPTHHILICPACNGTEADLLGRTGLGIEALEVE